MHFSWQMSKGEWSDDICFSDVTYHQFRDIYFLSWDRVHIQQKDKYTKTFREHTHRAILYTQIKNLTMENIIHSEHSIKSLPSKTTVCSLLVFPLIIKTVVGSLMLARGPRNVTQWKRHKEIWLNDVMSRTAQCKNI